jgi:hypothetical protein
MAVLAVIAGVVALTGMAVLAVIAGTAVTIALTGETGIVVTAARRIAKVTRVVSGSAPCCRGSRTASRKTSSPVRRARS